MHYVNFMPKGVFIIPPIYIVPVFIHDTQTQIECILRNKRD